MPPPPGRELGPPPPDAPRQLPRGFALRSLLTGNVTTILGCAFLGFAVVMISAMITKPSVTLAMPLGIFLAGFFMFRHGWVTASNMLRAFRRGRAVRGEIYSLNEDKTQSINGKHPWMLIYHFLVEGQLCEGTVVCWDTTVRQRSPGQALWVLYMENDPGQSTPYPPLK